MRNFRAERERQRRAGYKLSILQAAEAVIVKKGYSSLTMDDVAREAQFSKATLYRYFKNKGELIFEIVTQYYRDVTRNLLEIEASGAPPVEKLRRAIRFILRLGEEKKRLSWVFMVDECFPRFLRVFVGQARRTASSPDRRLLQNLKSARREMLRAASEILSEGMASGEFRAMDVIAGVTFLESVLQGYLHGELFCQKRHDLEAETELIHGFILHGLLSKGNVEGGAK